MDKKGAFTYLLTYLLTHLTFVKKKKVNIYIYIYLEVVDISINNCHLRDPDSSFV